MESKRSIAQYIGKAEDTVFVIPSYQRGYKWGVPHKDGKNDAKVLVEDIVRAYQSHKAEYFIQGVTVYKKDNRIFLIDGQQRTTTIFLILTAVISDIEERSSYLFTRHGDFRLEYKIRKSSHDYLVHIVKDKPLGDADTQDKYYIQTAYQQICDALPEDVEKVDPALSLSFKEYILNRVKLFYIEIEEQQATDVFSMMNGAKAYMKVDELVKADFLSKVSSSDNLIRNSEQTDSIDVTLDILRKQLKRESTEEWENNAVRSRFAREWDKWIYWWNQEEVKAFFESGENPLGLLLPTYCSDKNVQFSNSPDDLSTVIKDCQNSFIKDTKNAKLNFYELRELQKKYENLYRNTHSFNLLGIALSCTDKKRKKEIVDFFIKNYNSCPTLKRYTLGLLIDRKPDADDFVEQAESVISQLQSNFVYLDDGDSGAKEYAMRMLFMLNVMAADKRNSRFEFVYKDEKGFWRNFYRDGRSLEHIWPKSRIVFKDDDGVNKTVKLNTNNLEDDNAFEEVDSSKLNLYIHRDLLVSPPFEVSEHCIGNLVFLHKRDNSKFNAKTPEREGDKEGKKQVFFNLNEPILSRNLIQTIAAFSAGYWSKDNTPNRIKENKEETIQLIRKQYGL
jgi:hypothetical protein